jgi:hypothetical protein
MFQINKIRWNIERVRHKCFFLICVFSTAIRTILSEEIVFFCWLWRFKSGWMSCVFCLHELFCENMADYPNCKLSTSPSLLVCAHRITIDLLLQCDCSAALRFEPYYHQFETKHSLHSVKIITVTTSVISYAFCHFRLTILSAETNNHILNNKSSVLLSQIYPINIDLFCLN